MTSPATNANFYADFKSLSALKAEAKTDQQKALRAAAQEFESLFTSMMLKSMRAATSGIGGTDNSNEMDLYQGMFDQQIASQLSKGKGLGLADMLVQQLTRSGLVSGANAAHTQDADTQSSAAQSHTMTTSSTSVNTDEAAAASTNSASALMSPASFVKSLWPSAQAAAKKLGVDPATLVAHAALETGWGKHVPCNADGSSSFNLFGIKAGSTWQGSSVAASTQEFEQGTAVTRVDRFKSYASVDECLSDYASLLSDHSRFQSALNTGSDAGQFANALQRGGYATDPDYARKLAAVAKNVNSLATMKSGQAELTTADT
jgi:peptidoglycan hydrolase FlgJ